MTESATFSLNGRRVLYTGAAGGLGLPTTLQMLEDGATVYALDNDPDKAGKLRSASAEHIGKTLYVLETDLSDGVSLADTLATILDDGPLDVVINNAAIYPSKPFEEYTTSELSAVHAVNVEAAQTCVRAALPAMRDQSRGRVINITSITLNGGWENLAPYVQSKGALLGLTRAWAREFGKWGITVNAVAPGAFPTDAEKIHPDPEGYARFVLDHQSVKRRDAPADISAVLRFLASDAASFITGQTLNVDGGWNMQ